MTGTGDLAAWLTAVWDEEERLATAATPGPWSYTSRNYIETPPIKVDEADWGPEGHEGLKISTQQDDRAYRYADAAFIAHTHPTAVLARIAADRKILALHAPSDGNCRTCCGEPYCEVYWDGEEETVVWQRAALAWPCPTVLLKAEQYAARPDFPEWLVERQGVEQ